MYMLLSTFQFFFEFDLKLKRTLTESKYNWKLKTSMNEDIEEIAKTIGLEMDEIKGGKRDFSYKMLNDVQKAYAD